MKGSIEGTIIDYNEAIPGQSSVGSPPPMQPSVPEQPNNVGSGHSGLARRLEANSGAAFVRNLGLKIDLWLEYRIKAAVLLDGSPYLSTASIRLTDSPHPTWIASSPLIHLVEAGGLHG
ncbi:hypothetical protein DHEL01_v207038 [Diaporthe helianthi]|uniref:Uncharacterized protein n=1 Tax=Diaporthe helianthi TaxID=158607 RepID=A0A2P5HWC7_DIAHE|nr:hypothetical protein DHEL01_v207038 [Diaporthe helianthi]